MGRIPGALLGYASNFCPLLSVFRTVMFCVNIILRLLWSHTQLLDVMNSVCPLFGSS